MTPTSNCRGRLVEARAVVLLLIVTIVVFVRVARGDDSSVASAQRPEIPAELANVRFRSVFSLTGGPATSAVGVFTLRGPIVSTLRSLPYLSSGPVVFDDEDHVYAGYYRMDRNFERTQWGKETIGRVPPAAGIVTFDSRRKHLVGFGPGGFLYRYDVRARRWLDRLPFGESPRCTVYDPDNDVLLGIGPGERLRVYSPEGELKDTQDIAPPMTLPEQGMVQATWQAGRVILVTSATSSLKEGEQPGRVIVVDPREARTLYAGNIQLLDDAGQPLVWSRSTPAARRADEDPMPRLRGAYDALAKKLTAAERIELEDRLAELREHMAGDYGTRRDGAAEVHILAINAQDYLRDKAPLETTVNLDYRCRPVVLVLMTNHPTRFRLNLSDQTRLNRIYLLGRKGTGLRDPPPKAECVHWPFSYDDDRMPEFSGNALAATFPALMRMALQTESMTVHIVSRDRPELLSEVTLGPGDADWRRQHIAALIRGFERRIETLRIAAHGFLAVTQPDESDLRGPADIAPSGEGQRTVRSFWGPFDVTGPHRKSLKPLPIRATLMADGGPGSRFIAEPALVYRLDEARGEVTPLPWDGVEAPESVSGLAVDTKKKRLFAAVNCGDREFGYVKHPALYQWDFDTRRWSRAGYVGRPVAGLAYDSGRDVLYGFHGLLHGAHLSELMVLTTRGVRVASIRLPVGGVWHPRFGPPQLLQVDDRLVVLTPPRVPFGREGPAASEMFIVDPTTATAVFAGTFATPESSR